MGDWQPIETAPTDGTWFLCCRAGEGPENWELASYFRQTWPDYEPVHGNLFRKVDRVISEWRGANNMHRATHWIPLPAPPANVAKAGEQ